MRGQPSSQEREKILELFRQGNGVNHVVFHMDYKFDSDDVNAVIRTHLRELEKSSPCSEMEKRISDLQASLEIVTTEKHKAQAEAERNKARADELAGREEKKETAINHRLHALYQKYGHVTIEYFSPIGFYRHGCWRVWAREWHQHHFGLQNGSYGSFSSQGETLEEAISRFESSAAKYPPQPNPSCTKTCPSYDDPDY